MHRARLHLLLYVAVFLIPCASVVRAQTTIQRSLTPVVGHYPGGHVGLRGGETPADGEATGNFNRIHIAGTLKGAKGETLEKLDGAFYANITPFIWTTKKKILGMNYGGLLAIPVNDVYNRPSGQIVSSSGFGLGDVVTVPFILYGETKSLDFQFGAGPWMPTGTFNAGSSANHGAGFWEALYSAGFVYYPKANRRSWSISTVGRFEQNFTQRDTQIKVGNDIVIDYGVGKFFMFGNKLKQLLDVGVSGFIQTQVTHEAGVNRALNTSLYRVFGTGPEVRYYVPKWRTSILFRPQWDYGARNTSQGMSIWMAIGYKFRK